MTTEPELLGETVVLIGGSAGIGLETARHARREGDDPAALKAFFDGLPGPIDHVLTTAGGPRYRPPEDVAALAVHLMACRGGRDRAVGSRHLARARRT